ncbi:MAG: uncharacterized protein KVP18_002087 [Porospora cf. gigantea A]|uniref:uncharacterized protein n=1 Tax=Porospora cf. gigantea A TaxID=2853593 RepID=UPI003559A054|nr:MAG: hypothetical protein KVP18_002087 [Porospora cf. gigantea A]
MWPSIIFLRPKLLSGTRSSAIDFVEEVEKAWAVFSDVKVQWMRHGVLGLHISLSSTVEVPHVLHDRFVTCCRVASQEIRRLLETCSVIISTQLIVLTNADNSREFLALTVDSPAMATLLNWTDQRWSAFGLRSIGNHTPHLSILSQPTGTQ